MILGQKESEREIDNSKHACVIYESICVYDNSFRHKIHLGLELGSYTFNCID